MEKTCQDQSGNAVSVSAQLVQPAPPVQPAHTTGTPIEIPSKRTIADRTPPYVPTNVKKTITKPTTRSQMVKNKNLNVSTSDFKLSLDKPVDFSFSQNDPASKPFFTREFPIWYSRLVYSISKTTTRSNTLLEPTFECP
ncbi:hypothetical protein G6F44_012797 [Rhizopus delemar]|nr:hypothetical protein G6F44_012797 [Rhizopus delemar]